MPKAYPSTKALLARADMAIAESRRLREVTTRDLNAAQVFLLKAKARLRAFKSAVAELNAR